MIEYQLRFPEFPGHKWHELVGNLWQEISLRDIKKFRFRFHGNLVERRRYLNAYLEKEIIHARLLGKPIASRMLNNDYKK
jgi:hypothetical protein